MPEVFLEGWNRPYQTKQQWRQAGQRLLSEGVMEPFEYAIRLFELNDMEAFSLALALAYEADTRYRQWFEMLGHSSAPKAGLAVEAYGLKENQDEWYQAFCRGGSLQNWFLRQTADEEQKGLLELPLLLDVRMTELFLADQWEDPVVKRLGEYEYPHIEEELQIFNSDVYKQWTELFCSGCRGVFHLCGPKGAGKKTQLSRFAGEQGKTVIHIHLDRMDGMDSYECRRAISGILRECRLHQAFLCLEGVGGEHKEGQMQGVLLEKLLRLACESLGCVFCLDESSGSLPGGLSEVTARLPLPDMGQSAALWEKIGSGYPMEEGVSLWEFASLFSMTPGQIKTACEMAARRAGAQGGRIGTALLKETCRSLLDCGMGDKARRVDCRYSWEDLILGREAEAHIREACLRIRGRSQVYCRWGFGAKLAYGTGVAVLFAGPPGTGKTMAAQVMAGELGLSLYKIDLSTVVSKYIGDTEKNLNQIFEAGKRNQCVLFFDEADVLFSKRTEVKDANDKYSNMEAAFLLQRMEEYAGVVILATNYLQNIEEAFKRRLTYVIDFPLPDREQRKELWISMFPEDLVVDEDVDLDFLAEKFEMSGSQIKNSVLNGAFLALNQGKDRVGMRQLVISVQRELKKSGKHLTPQDFGEYYLLMEE